MLESGIASAEDIDVSCRLGLGHSLGPLSTCDLVGLDVLLNITESMFDELRDSRVVPPTLLRRMVAAGQLGKKSGIGFFEYSNSDG
jgi:3-hydroxybutyryl-CoA dehydrogenase